MPTLQALSAAGQSRLMEHYNRSLARHELVAAQVLLVPHDFVDRRQYLHARQTLLRLLELGCIPIINENDAIASDEIRYGDNDRIAALVAHNVNADLLVLLTDTAGLFTADPRTDSAAELISEVLADDPLLAVSAGATGSIRGSGGMASKLAAARMASWSRRARGHRRRRSRRTCWSTRRRRDRSAPRSSRASRRSPARKLWIGFASQVEGVVTRRRRRAPGAGRAGHVAAAGRRRRCGRRLRRG